LRRFILALAILLLPGLAADVSAREIAADLSSHEIEITAGFDGAELLLYGHDAHAADVIVIVRGPPAPTAVRKKARVAGIWINQAEVEFPQAPGFYFVAATEGLRAAGELDSVLQETGLGARYLGLAASGGTNPELADEFRRALIELRGRQQLFSTEPALVEMRKDGLFRTKVPFPAATPVGQYTVMVYHVAGGWPVAGDSTPLQVRKAGFGAFVYDFAHQHPPLYGIIAILVALGAGWFGGWAFKRG
jgi:uncharacterized protein (TIGR02186 family)